MPQPKQKTAPVAVLEALVDAHRIIMAVAIDQFDTARKRLAEAKAAQREGQVDE